MVFQELSAGEVVGRYEILFPIASGGMATVYAARAAGEATFRKPIALKLMLPHLARDVRFAKMFVDEATLAAAIHSLQWMEVTFTWATSFESNNLSGVNTTWSNITSDPVASVVYNPAGGWYFYVAVALPARIGSVWGSRVYVYRRAEASAGALSLMLPQVADFPGVFVQPAAAGAGGYAEVFTSSSF